jgi:ergothioneine biosynthesis protein EgtB
LADVLAYRAHVDQHMEQVFARGELSGERATIVEVGIHHEQQHQELILTDIKHLLSCHPLWPVYRSGAGRPSGAIAPQLEWRAHAEGVERIGYDGDGFAYDNETPRHRVFVEAFEIASRPVTAGEYLEFMRDGGYGNPLLWLSDGWTAVQTEEWRAPLYWEERDGEWFVFTLGGLRPVDAHEPICHISYFEADAYARWAGARLPSEPEWEIAGADAPIAGNFMESERYHPVAAERASAPLHQIMGDVWEWTKSGYEPYPGYQPPEGPLGEYNSKFMCSQLVLRGGSCATPESHIRPTYRNFFPPSARWQFSGLRLARD